MSGHSEAISRLDIEWIAVKAGVKPALRITIAPERIGDLERRAHREGFAVARAAEMATFPTRPPAAILYISPDPERTRELADAEAPLLPFVPGRVGPEEGIPLHTRLGLLLGYPRCCVEEFCARIRRGVTRRIDGRHADEDFVAAECAARASQRFLGRLNDLSANRRVRIVTFYPCRYDCPEAASYAGGVFAQAERADATAASALRAALIGTVSIGVDGGRGSEASSGIEVLGIDFAEF